jgi:two-component system nitrate/nitrite response regulator NarL
MRLLICDYHLVFAESLAYVLAGRGMHVVAVARDPDQLLETLRQEPVDICLFDLAFGTGLDLDRLAELRLAAPGTRFVLLTAAADRKMLAAARAAGVRGVGDKRQPVSEIIHLLERVYAGEWVASVDSTSSPSAPGTPWHPCNEVQRLAGFLTPREREVLSALVRGDDTNKLARSLGIATATARCHVQNVLTKLGAHSRLEAATSAVRYGMVSPETGDWLTPG